MKNKVITSVLSASLALMLSINASASVLGTTKINGYSVEVGQGTVATHNVWYSDQSGVGQQTENYVTYTPNSGTEPIITSGGYVYGTSTITTEVSRLKGYGTVPVAGANADFFSFQTGVPMSNVITNGEILAKDESNQYAIGYLNDNTAFMSKMTLYTTLKRADGSLFRIHNVNKYRQPYSIYLFTDKFSKQTHNNTNGYDVILNNVNGSLKIGTQLTATVESVTEYNGSIALPAGKLVISVDAKAPAEYVNAVKSLQPGEQITISTGAEGDARWKDAKLAIGATGGMLVQDGVVNTSLPAGASPRTALGIKSDGSTILYTIDGRQKGYSYGVQLKTLASRMVELGCTDAINLDGGGSTSFVLQFPGESTATLTNKPSEGSLRSVSNFIFFRNNLAKTGVAGHLTIYPLNSYVLTGASTQLSVKASDSGYHAMATPSDLTYSVEDGAASTVTNTGMFTANDAKPVTVYATAGGVTASRSIICIKTPTTLDVYNEANSSAVKSLSLKRVGSVNLTAKAYAGYNHLVANDSNFTWKCDENVGKIDQNGLFTAADKLSASGNIYVTAGDKTVTIPVTIAKDGTETDERMFPELNAEKAGNSYTINIKNYYGITVKNEDITVKADGKEIPYSFNNSVLSFTAPEESVKVTVFVTNSEGNSSFYTDTRQSDGYTNPFADTKGNWAEDIISYMYKNGVINGQPSDNGLIFNPAKAMTRSEFAVMITNYLGLNLSDYKGVVLPYADKSSIPSWAEESYKALYKLGIMKGASSDGKLYAHPSSNITRAETASLISRTMPNGIRKAQLASTDKSEIPQWAYDSVAKLMYVNAIKGYPDGSFKPLNNVAKAEALKILYTIM